MNSTAAGGDKGSHAATPLLVLADKGAEPAQYCSRMAADGLVVATMR
jgi:hypothetical protein